MGFEGYMVLVGWYLSQEYGEDIDVCELTELLLDGYNFGLTIPNMAGDVALILKGKQNG